MVKSKCECKPDLPFKVGDAIMIRTVTMIDVGRVIGVTPDLIVLTDGGWIASTGRFSVALSTGSLAEFERCDLAWFAVSRGAIVDIFPWVHDLPKTTK